MKLIFGPPYKGVTATIFGMTWARAAIFYGSDVGRDAMLERGWSKPLASTVPAIATLTPGCPARSSLGYLKRLKLSATLGPSGCCPPQSLSSRKGRSVLPAAQAADKYITALFDLADHDQSGDLSVEELAWLLDSVQDHHHDHHAPHAAAPAPNSP